MDLYFIALIPHPALSKEIRALKDEIYKNTGAKKAFNAPAHITIQRPFRRADTFENKLKDTLKLFAAGQNSFSIALSGFGCFEPRVIFVDVLKTTALLRLHADLYTVLSDDLDFKPKEMNETIHPHVTIATRDLNKSSFYKVWPTYKDREFENEFTAKSIFLLKHNGKIWEILDEFLFKK